MPLVDFALHVVSSDNLTSPHVGEKREEAIKRKLSRLGKTLQRECLKSAFEVVDEKGLYKKIQVEGNGVGLIQRRVLGLRDILLSGGLEGCSAGRQAAVTTV